MLLNSDEISTDLGTLALRVTAGGTLLMQHGLPKLMAFGNLSGTFSDPLGVGHFISLVLILLAEVVAATLVTLGLWTRISTIPPIIAMAVATFMQHGDEPFKNQELGFLYLMAFISVFLLGSGRFSLDRLNFR
ncbi:MAG: DoxX family protein [Flavobacteriales bacterium]